jgi:DNA-binding NarL/FixJ family response regulator
VTSAPEAVVRVVVAEDQRLVREGIVTMLTVTGDFDVVAEAENGAQALQAARRTRPDVALVDLRMPVMDGIEATRRIVSEIPDTKVLVLTTFGQDDLLFAALGAGASGFLLKDVPAEQLLEAVAAVARGEGRIDPSVTATVVRHFRRHHQPDRTPARARPALTTREDEVLRLLARGMTNVEIAAELHVAPGTVKTHVATILAKLGARDRLQAVIIAYESGRVTP